MSAAHRLDPVVLRRSPELVRDTPEVIRRASGKTPDDRIALLAAVAGSFATTWVLYTQVLPFSGKTGFLLFWFALYVVFQAVLTSLQHPRAIVAERVATAFVVAAPALIGLALLSTVVSTVWKGLKPIGYVNFLFDDMSGVAPAAPFNQGGILHAVTGTLIEVFIAVLIAMPLGVATAVYMSEVGGRLSRLIRSVVEAMTALPSIVAGLFIYAVWLIAFGQQASGFAAGLALAVMALPIMARASDVVLRVVPGGLREASYALGASKWQTVWHVVLPTARPGLATALILGVARAVGETAPLLLTSGASTFFNANPFKDPMNSLPLFIYASVSSGNPVAEERGYAAAAVLLALVLGLFTMARLIARPPKGTR
jgi:phosphate transport system permease protein